MSLSSLTTCAADPPGAPAQLTPAQLLHQIQALIGDAQCDNAAQCHTIGVGHKACGGPGSYLAWSSKYTRETKLKALVARQAEAEQRESEKMGVLSDCSMVPDPGAVCVASRCQLGPVGGALPAAK